MRVRLESSQTSVIAAGRIWRFAAILALFLNLLLLRVLPFSREFLALDEILTGSFTNRMTQALLVQDWSRTANNAYPAVSLMWLEVVQLGAAELWPGEHFDNTQVLSDTPQEIGTTLPRRRLTLALISVVTAVVVFWLLRRLFNDFVATTATILMALDPFLLTQFRVFRVEGLVTNLMLLSALIVLLYVREQKIRWLVISGILGGLAALTKITALYLLSFTGLTLLVWPLLEGRRVARSLIRQTVRDLSLWSLVMVGTFFVLWPALWVSPVEALGQMFAYLNTAVTGLVNWGGQGAFFFNGRVLRNEDPGPLFYVWALAYRTTPFTWLGILAALGSGIFFLGWRRKPGESRNSGAEKSFRRDFTPTLLTLAYVVFFFVAMSLGKSKVDRYLHPIFPGLSILAAVGFQWIFYLIQSPSPERPGLVLLSSPKVWIFWGVLLMGGAWLALPHHPYYSTYWNPLLGSGRSAVKMLPVGGNEGVDSLISYLNGLPGASEIQLSGLSSVNCKASFTGSCLELSEFLDSDYFIIDILSLQRELYLTNLQALIPEAELVDKYTKDGVDYAGLYKMPEKMRFVRQNQEWLDTHGRLFGYGFSTPTARAGDSLEVNIFWQNGQNGWTLGDSEFWAKLLDENDHVYQEAPARLKTLVSVDKSQPDQMLLFTAPLLLPPDLLLGDYHLEIDLQLKTSGESTWEFLPPDPPNLLTVDGGVVGVAPEALPIQHWLKKKMGQTGLTLLGYDEPNRVGRSSFFLYWRADNRPSQQYRLSLALIDEQGRVAAKWQDRLALGIHPLDEWEPGEIVKTAIPLEVGRPLPVEDYEVLLELWPEIEGDAVARTPISLLRQFRTAEARTNVRYPVGPAKFGRNLELLGYDLQGRGTGSEGQLELTLNWLNRDSSTPVEAEVTVTGVDGVEIGRMVHLVPERRQQQTWHVYSTYKFLLVTVPASISIKARPAAGNEEWYKVHWLDQPASNQVVIENVLEKITVVQ